MTQTFPIVGMHFRPPASGILQVLPLGAALIARRESTNAYDSNAIAVWCPTSSIPDHAMEELDLIASGYGFDIGRIMMELEWQLGYIPAKLAMFEAPKWDAASIAQCPGEISFTAEGKPLITY